MIPCFEGLLPNQADEAAILDLLYLCVYWHGLAKLRMHTDSSLTELDTATKALCNCIRHFAVVVCPHYDTFELPSELAARKREEVRRDKTRKGVASGETSSGSAPSTGRKRRSFSLATPKLHQLLYYVLHIPRWGTTDGISTQIVS
jgi:hypothetical protein